MLVILVEQLGFNSFSCGEEEAEESNGGYSAFCAEAVRFTHAYAPSPMSQPSIASIISGLYPYQHGVRHNGAQFLASNSPNVAKEAVARGYRTSFFSGGPPIFRKSGFNAGFETFDDSAYPTLKSLYRPALETARLFLAWKDSEAGRSSFFSVLYLPDLQFPDAATTNNLGEARDLSWASQNLEINQTLGYLVRELKNRNAWDRTYVFLAGLNSHSELPRDGEMRALNLNSDSLRVRLMAKPARRPGRESPFNWKVDSNVSLVDLGATLFDVIGAKVPPCDDPAVRSGPAACDGQAPISSLKSALDGPQPAWREDRALLAESAWASWRGVGSTRYALRKGPYLFIGDARPRLFNAFMDPLEATPLRGFKELRAEFESALATVSSEPWQKPSGSALEAIELGAELWKSASPSTRSMSRLKDASNARPEDARLSGWRATLALRQENWNELKAIGDRSGQPMWSYVASLNMGLKPAEPADPCLRVFRKAKGGGFEAPSLRECASADVLELIEWTGIDESASAAAKQKAQDSFFRVYSWRLIDSVVAERNYALGLIWDASPDAPGAPKAVDLLLALPENRKYRSALARRLSEATGAGKAAAVGL